MYNPTVPPQTIDKLREYLYDELLQISSILHNVEEGRFFPMLHNEPRRPREGMLSVADGTDWNPGGGRGLYEYRNGVWEKL